MKDIDLRLIKESKNDYRTQINLIEYEHLRDSLTESGITSITLKLDTILDVINFRNTRMDGSFKRYSNDDRLIIEGKYKNGIEDSIWTFYNMPNEVLSKKYFEKGELIKTEIFENSKIKAEQKYDNREKTIRSKYFHLAILFTLIIGLMTKLSYNFKRTNSEDVIKVSNFSKIAGSLLLPLGVLILAKIFSSIIPNSYSTFFLGIFGEAILVYLITTPLFLLIFYYLKLRRKLDLIYYILLLALSIVLIEEWIYLREII